jgi:integrase/recombinase XerC
VRRAGTHLPLTRRHYNTLFEHVQARLDFAAHTPVTAHVLRHTAITRVERLAGFAVAQRFAGHAHSSVTSTYTKADISEVASAVAALTGETHPLAMR